MISFVDLTRSCSVCFASSSFAWRARTYSSAPDVLVTEFRFPAVCPSRIWQCSVERNSLCLSFQLGFTALILFFAHGAFQLLFQRQHFTIKILAVFWPGANIGTGKSYLWSPVGTAER
ncbi:hypothetical protein KCP69_25715 [Salmonella enterica subsp. enterica]|nr:hypothetical protein KCP69_25715 [Salmonella enterica subsp. enterica]